MPESLLNVYTGMKRTSVFVTAANSGVITLRQKLDHETKPFYNITIAARDLGSPTLSGYVHLLVTVTDVDDNAPVFHSDKYTADLLENATAGTFVAQVNASDMDAAEEHKTIYYRIEGGNDDKHFVIGEVNGTVYLNWTGVGLDREKVALYTLTVAAISRVNDTEQKTTVDVSIEFPFTFYITLFNWENVRNANLYNTHKIVMLQSQSLLLTMV